MNISTYKEQKAKASLFGKIGIFSASLLTAASAVYIYSPVIGSHADENTTSKVSATINPVASVTLDTSDISFTFTPTASGVFESKPVNATVDTNSTGGYELYFSSEDNETNMTNALSSVTNVIASDFTGTVTSSSMAANKWGYSLNNTDFSKIPALNAQATLKNIDHYPTTAEKTTTVNIGMKVDTNLPSGTYSKNVVFSVLAHETPLPFGGISSMQEMTSEFCSTTAVRESTTLTDTRDSNTYTVKKLADGKCWMTENLRIANKTITSADSNVTSDFTIPASSISGFSIYDTNNAYVDSTYGGYYTFYTATAGTGGISFATTGANAPSSICPKGWRLPTGGSSGEFQTLYNNSYNSSALMQGEPNFTFSGYVYDGSVYGQGDYGYFWSSTVYDANYAYDLYLKSSNVYPADLNNKYIGFSVRCVAQ